MSEQLLDRPNVVTGLEKVRREAVPQCVRRRGSGLPASARARRRRAGCALVEMVAAPEAAARALDSTPREHPLPGQDSPARGYLRSRACGSSTPGTPAFRFASQSARTLPGARAGRPQSDRQRRAAILSPLPARTTISRRSNHAGAQAEGFQEPQPGSVRAGGRQAGARPFGTEPPRLFAREHTGAMRAAGAGGFRQARGRGETSR